MQQSRCENPHFWKNARFKCCFVPGCCNSALKNPKKIFITVPKGDKRLKWLTQVRRDPGSLSLQSTMYCCEDHFDLQEDLENYMRVKLDASAKIQLKKGVLPRFFNCQLDRKRAHVTPVRALVQKLRRTEILKKIQQEQDYFNKKQHSGDTEKAICPNFSFVKPNWSKSNKQKRNITFDCSTKPITKDVAIQVSLKIQNPDYRNKYVQCNLSNLPPINFHEL